MRRSAAGSVTVFYAGILLMLIALLGSVMESVRVHTARSMLADSAYLALQNSLAGYQRELWDDYHIFVIDTREAGGTEGLTEELQANLDRSWRQGGLLTERDWMGVACRVDAVSPLRYLTESDGLELENQILAYMKYRSITGAGEMLLEQLGLVEGLTQGDELITRKLELEQSFSDLEQQKTEIVRQVDGMEAVWQQAGAALISIRQKQQSAAGEEPAQPDILPELDTIYRVAGNLASQSAYLQGECTDYQEMYRQASTQKNEYGSWLESQREALDEKSWSALQTDLQELENWQQQDAGYVESLSGQLGHNQVVLQQLHSVCAQGMAAEEVSVDGMAAALTGLMSQYRPVELPENYVAATGGTGESPFDRLRDIASEGVLALVLPSGTQVSKATLEPASWQKEEENQQEETEKSAEDPAGSEVTVAGLAGEVTGELINRLLLTQYASEHFGRYGESKEDTVLQYEREYLLIGSSSDRNNLTGVVAEILLIRTTADFLRLLTDPVKVAEARELAMAIAGATGSSALIPVIKTGILLLWAVEDAVVEVQQLMKGEKVSLYEDLSAFALDYEGYLSLLLMLGQKGRNLRTARLIEGNIQLRYEEEFQVSDCVAGLGISLTAEVTPKLLREDPWCLTEEYELGYSY